MQAVARFYEYHETRLDLCASVASRVMPSRARIRRPHGGTIKIPPPGRSYELSRETRDFAPE